MSYTKKNKITGETRTFDTPAEEYDNVTDRTTAEMIGEHLEASLTLLKQVRPECKGFMGIAQELPNGDVRVTIDLIEGYASDD